MPRSLTKTKRLVPYIALITFWEQWHTEYWHLSWLPWRRLDVESWDENNNVPNCMKKFCDYERLTEYYKRVDDLIYTAAGAMLMCFNWLIEWNGEWSWTRALNYRRPGRRNWQRSLLHACCNADHIAVAGRKKVWWSPGLSLALWPNLSSTDSKRNVGPMLADGSTWNSTHSIHLVNWYNIFFRFKCAWRHKPAILRMWDWVCLLTYTAV